MFDVHIKFFHDLGFTTSMDVPNLILTCKNENNRTWYVFDFKNGVISARITANNKIKLINREPLENYGFINPISKKNKIKYGIRGRKWWKEIINLLKWKITLVG